MMVSATLGTLLDKGCLALTALGMVVAGALMGCRLAPFTVFFAGNDHGAVLLLKTSRAIILIAFGSPFCLKARLGLLPMGVLCGSCPSFFPDLSTVHMKTGIGNECPLYVSAGQRVLRKCTFLAKVMISAAFNNHRW
jgi:hypothetical protein